jgi:Ca2+-transporting ATPase
MRRAPRDPRVGIFTRPVIILMVMGGIWLAIVNLSLFFWALISGRSQEEARTMTYVSVVLLELFKAYNFRSVRISVFHKPFANKWLNLAVTWELLLLSLIVYLPVLHPIFGTFSLPLLDWIIVFCLAVTVIPVLELGKWMERNGWFGRLV